MNKKAPKTKYDVSLRIVSRIHTLAEISRAIELEPSRYSPEKGNAVPKPFGCLQKKFSKTCWTLESGCRPTASLAKHFNTLFAKIPQDLLIRIQQLDSQISHEISVGIFACAPMKTSIIETKHLQQMAAHGAKLEITYYSSK